MLQRAPAARVLGIALAAIGAFWNLFFYQANDGWAFTLIVAEIVIIFLLAIHKREFA